MWRRVVIGWTNKTDGKGKDRTEEIILPVIFNGLYKIYITQS
jgi:hypothetical protein